MYTSHIGRRLLSLYHQRTGEELSARQFFEQRLYPLFYAHKRFLQWVPSSPFAQDFNKDEKALVALGDSPYEIKLGKLHNKIDSGLAPDASFVIGFPAAGAEGTTSGQVSGVGPKVSSEEIYCSWIGGALGVGVSGGLSLLLDEDDVLWALYEGWAHYRTFLEQRPTMKGNQIETWNGHWLAHAFSPEFDPAYPLDEFKIDLTDTAGTLAMPTREWVQVLFALTRHYPTRDLMAYVYSLAQTNRTIGFVPLQLRGINKVYDLTEKLFLFPEAVRSAGQAELLRLYTVQYGFARACQMGAIGLAAIEPAKLRDYLPSAYGPAKPPATKTEAAAIQFAFHQLWILAMLNNQELYDTADRLAGALHQFAIRDIGKNAGRGKNNVNQQVEQVFVKHRPLFIDKLSDMLAAVNAASPYRDAFDEAVRQVMLMPVDNFPLFIILTRFRYIARQNEGVLPAGNAKADTAAPAFKDSAAAAEQTQLNLQ
ncbi:hypothetical protein ACFST9_22010 [Hymenobacter monticola]|uniref:Type I-B CRISPR-associated protein Cas8b1/Cst1 n=1 Tax=Hymenobacter monticola TaxID=1705399 RepID=A0ABY4B502_9BACT|nr:hypothetical protein [Hymenobacter monticola]UOE34222.1 hypothetical protein MTP16_00895 [Hymenobacter monticola]